MTSTRGFSSLFEQGRLKPGVYKIQNIYTETYLDISLHSMELCCRPGKDLGVGRGLWQILKFGEGYAVRRVDQGNPSLFCGPLHGLNDRAGIYITAYPSAWRIKLANEDKYPGFEYVRFHWATTEMTWDLWAGNKSDGARVKFHPSSTKAWQVWRLIPEEAKGTTTSLPMLSEFLPLPAHGGVTKPPPSYNSCPYGCTPINFSAARSVPGSGLSVVAPETNSRRLIHQALNGTLKQRLAAPGASLDVNPSYLTPLATLSWDSGNQARVYYLDSNFVIRDRCLTNGNWSTGKLADELGNIKAAPGAGLAATLLPNKTNTRIHVYYQAIDPQETQARIIRQLIFDGASWRKGKLDIGGSLADTSLSAVAYFYDGQDHTRVFYQAENLSLKDHLYNKSGWQAGDFNPGKVAARSPISAIAFGEGEVQVYWRDLVGCVVFAKNTRPGWSPARVVMEVRATYRFSAMQWSDGESLKVYYQDFAGSLFERRSDDGGDTWEDGGPAL